MDTRLLVANRILELCDNKKITIHALARSAGVPPSTVKSILNGASKNPGIVTIKLLCDSLKISLYDFFDEEAFKDLEQEMD